ncbi:3-phosphoshikimate 1-carboxyvinyltransferase [Flavobacterium urocaniciphilum]|uniref:3-phosphoshikimate 1-carboxyvinyltransferase n=1 Tax=Flavobacterium urocaniciphilum TaxID=1299341 RepID=A0A1H9C9J4_9FLAO|nr:3-phosphoshikimate 1-carboxyvinyltransferase [Flavobacterium urocaniciphilum]SEP97814.1 3-phosphoshikimate 1-carboxyvinyltransferase [Flavobacterium urocaniciphilum]
MNLHLLKSKIVNLKSEISITGSKSETNRLLLLQAIFPNLQLENTSNSDDSDIMQKTLQSIQLPTSSIEQFDIHHAGTAMRFLTAYFAIQEGNEVILTGSSRMQERPIQILVDALNQLGADISYQNNEGFPPLKIKGKKLSQSKVSLPANISSQYISALLLIAPKLENGLELTLEGEITSIPYINMTLVLLQSIGVDTSFENNIIKVAPKREVTTQTLVVESDWSSASYWFSIVALSEIGTEITLSSYKENSLQGDSVLAEIYKDFGVETVFNENNTITISKTKNNKLSIVNYQLNNCPDIAQTIAVTCFGLGIGCDLFGLHTLKIKETDRLEALKVELTKLGAEITVTNDSLHLKASQLLYENICIATYQDHRMAMAFAPLALKVGIQIENAEVVSKSYPSFWEDLKKVGFEMQPLSSN